MTVAVKSSEPHLLVACYHTGWGCMRVEISSLSCSQAY